MSKKMDSLDLSDRLMMRGWWHEAEAVLDRPDVSASDRLLQGCCLICRKECVEWIAAHPEIPVDDLPARLLRDFDVYTVQWVLHQYAGEGAPQWRRNEKASDLMD